MQPGLTSSIIVALLIASYGLHQLPAMPKDATQAKQAGLTSKGQSSSLLSQPKQTLAFIRKAEFEVVGAGCVTCIRQIERLLKNVPGVESATIAGVVPPKATVIYDMDKTSMSKFVAAIRHAGYNVRNQKDSFYSMTPKKKSLAPATVDMSDLRDATLR